MTTVNVVPSMRGIDGFERSTLVSGLVAGFATGLFSIPEGMAYAKLAGVNPLYGLYSGLVATLFAALSTGSVLMISTLTSAIALSTGSVMVAAGIGDEDLPNALFTITLLTGVVMLVLGLLRLGSMVNFVSNSVMTGFVAGASLLILIGELGDFSGYDPEGGNKLTQVVDWFAHVGDWDGATTAVAVATIVLVVIGKRIRVTEKLAPVIVLIVMTVVVGLGGWASVATVADIATIPSGLPGPVAPDFSVIPLVALGSISVAVVALVQGAGISTAYPNPSGSTASASRDFVGQGIGNIAGSFFQSMSTGGSLSRTGISVSGGARSRWGGVFAALWLGVLMLLLGSQAEKVPLAVIAGLLFVIAAELVLGRLPSARLVYSTSATSTVAMLLTFVSALFIPLQWTIFLGMGLCLVVYLADSTRSGRVDELVRGPDGYWQERPAPDVLPPGQVTVIGLRDWGFFAGVPRLAQRLPRPDGAEGAALVVRMRSVESIRSTGIRVLEAYHRRLQDAGVTLVLAGVAPAVAQSLEKAGTTSTLGADNVVVATASITQSLDRAVERAHTLTSAAPDEGAQH
ncbi:STAS domain-containing protein [Cellulomonas sp. DKR-3]|uniref:STAS domain-containing protein n=1 Tax=Cellulomonas fulva TaxID=2835530 RepID=A0ABS5U2D4_9CELL|nr:SulP family inorganic anion transporter [Cellulomonas fulva]MBT0995552.1 STAS domain-containing protein [Cellulomonas fulva]